MLSWKSTVKPQNPFFGGLGVFFFLFFCKGRVCSVAELWIICKGTTRNRSSLCVNVSIFLVLYFRPEMGNHGRTRKSTKCVWKKRRCTMLWAQGLQNNKGQFEIKLCCQETVTTTQKCWLAEVLVRWWEKVSRCLCYVKSIKQHSYLGTAKHNNAHPYSSKSSPSASGHRLI